MNLAYLIFPVMAFAKGGAPHREMAEHARIPSREAVKIAQKAQPGSLLSMNLEKAEGGHLVYSVQIMHPDANLMEVVVDAGDGRVLSLNKVRSHEHQDHVKEGAH